MRFDRLEIPDPEVDGITGATAVVPDGHTVQSGFVWMPTFSMQANLYLQVTEPATGATSYVLPTQQFCWPMQPMPGMQPGGNWLGSMLLPPPRNPVECVQWFYLPGPLQHLRMARLVGVEELPGYATEVGRGVPPQMTVRATRLRYAYSWGGGAWEEDVYLNLTYDQPNGWTAIWWCSAYALRAPGGTLDERTALLLVPMLSLRLTLDWSAMLDHAQSRFRQEVRRQQTNPGPGGAIWAPMQPLGEVWRQKQGEIREGHRVLWNVKQAAHDRQNLAFRAMVPGLHTYVDPFDSRPVELPNEAVTYWTCKEGKIIASEEFSFDPPEGITDEWRPMSRYAPPA